MKLTPEQFRQAFEEGGHGAPFFTSDLHYEHKRICEYAGRPWAQDKNTYELTDRWNVRVGLLDEVYHLGDFAFLWPKQLPQMLEIIGELNGQIHFIRGNHCDPRTWDKIEDQNMPHVVWVKDYHELKIEAQPIILCHYPMEVWNGSHHGSWHLHGHCHGSLPSRGKRLDVGIDNHPEHQIFSYPEIKLYMGNRDIEIRDHHDGRRP